MTGPGGTEWRTSSYSGANNECVEVADTGHGQLVRDSKVPGGPTLRLSRGAWTAFLGGLKLRSR